MRAPAVSTCAALAALSLGCGGAAPEPAAPAPAAVVDGQPADAEPALPEVDRSKLPTPAPPPKWALPSVQTWKLSNGIGVWFLKYGETPLVSVKLIVPHGAATDPKGKAGLTSLMADLLDEGAGGKTTLELSEQWQRLATDYGASVGTDSVTFGLNTLVDSLGESLALLSDVVRRPKLDRKEFQRRKDQAIAAELSGEARPGNARMVVLRRALFGDGYGAFTPSGTRSTLKKLTLRDVRAHYEKVIAPTGAAFVVVGGVEAAEAKQLLEASFGGWKHKATAATATVSPKAPKRGVYFIDYPGKTQSSVAVARRSDGALTPDLFDALVMNRVLGGQFSSRLNLNLREDKGYTYGARSSFNRWKHAGFFSLTASVKTETTRGTLDEMFREASALCGTRPLSKNERKEAVDGLLLGFPGRFERVSSVASQLSRLPLYGRSPDWYSQWPARVSAVTLQAANAIGKKYCDPEALIVVIAGDRAKVVPTLEGLGLEVFDYDAQGNPKR